MRPLFDQIGWHERRHIFLQGYKEVAASNAEELKNAAKNAAEGMVDGGDTTKTTQSKDALKVLDTIQAEKETIIYHTQTELAALKARIKAAIDPNHDGVTDATEAGAVKKIVEDEIAREKTETISPAAAVTQRDTNAKKLSESVLEQVDTSKPAHTKEVDKAFKKDAELQKLDKRICDLTAKYGIDGGACVSALKKLLGTSQGLAEFGEVNMLAGIGNMVGIDGEAFTKDQSKIDAIKKKMDDFDSFFGGNKELFKAFKDRVPHNLDDPNVLVQYFVFGEVQKDLDAFGKYRESTAVIDAHNAVHADEAEKIIAPLPVDEKIVTVTVQRKPEIGDRVSEYSEKFMAAMQSKNFGQMLMYGLKLFTAAVASFGLSDFVKDSSLEKLADSQTSKEAEKAIAKANNPKDKNGNDKGDDQKGKDIDAAQTLISEVINDKKREELQKKLKGTPAGDAETATTEKMKAADDAVKAAEANTTNATIDAAKTNVEALADGDKKTEFKKRLTALYPRIAGTTLTTAETTPTDENLTAAERVIGELPADEKKTDLTKKLETLYLKVAKEVIGKLAATAVAGREAATARADRLIAKVPDSHPDKVTLTTQLKSAKENFELEKEKAVYEKRAKEAGLTPTEITKYKSVTTTEAINEKWYVNDPPLLIQYLKTIELTPADSEKKMMTYIGGMPEEMWQTYLAKIKDMNKPATTSDEELPLGGP